MANYLEKFAIVNFFILYSIVMKLLRLSLFYGIVFFLKLIVVFEGEELVYTMSFTVSGIIIIIIQNDVKA
jgi:hypothetical protein